MEIDIKDIKSEESDDEVLETAETDNSQPFPAKSRERYEAAYITYVKWQASKNFKHTTESVLKAYFQQLSKKYKPPTLWTTRSMLKSTMMEKEGIDISQYKQLTAFLKRQSDGYKGPESRVLSLQDVETFLKEAPVNKYLATKVALIFGICGACRREELAALRVKDVQHQGDTICVNIPDTKSKVSRTFVIEDEFCQIVENYESLRPPNPSTDRYFLNYQNGKCTGQVIGKNKFGTMPKQIAQYLKLPDASLYTGHSFRRTSATLLADPETDRITLKGQGGYKSSTAAEKFVEDSINSERKIGHIMTSSISMASSTSAASSTPTSLSNAPAFPLSAASSTVTEPKIPPMTDIKQMRVIATTSETIDIVLDSTMRVETKSPNPVFHFHNCNINIHYQK